MYVAAVAPLTMQGNVEKGKKGKKGNLGANEYMVFGFRSALTASGFLLGKKTNQFTKSYFKALLLCFL